MHFKYDQNLEMHNGIHAAIRGKLLEATFAPVWVEPLECSVLGGGFGEAGSTTAQTFALSGVSGSGMKRPRMLMKMGTRTLSMSTLLNAYCQLHDDTAAFGSSPAASVVVRLQADAAYRGGVFHRDEPARQALLTMWPSYCKLRRDKARLDATVFPAPTQPGLTADEKELARKLQALKVSVEKMFLFADGTLARLPGFKVDAFVYALLVSLQLKGSLLDRMEVLMSQCIERAVAQNSNTATRQTGWLDSGIFTAPSISLQHWRAAALFAPSIWASAHFAQNKGVVDWAGNLVVFEDSDENRLSALGSFQDLLVMAALLYHGEKRDASIVQMAVMAMPFLALNLQMGQTFHNTPMAFNARENLGSLLRLNMGGLKAFFEGFQSPNHNAILSNSRFVEQVLVCIVTSFGLFAELNWEYGIRPTIVGSYLGSMFAFSACWKAFKATGVDVTGSFVPAVGLDPFTGSSRYCTVGSRLCMLATSRFMVAAGMVLGNIVQDKGLQSPQCVADMSTALFLVYLHLMMTMQEKFDNDFRGANGDQRRAKYDSLVAMQPDLPVMCKLAWSTVKGFAGKTSTEIVNLVKTMYAPHDADKLKFGAAGGAAVEGFLSRKFDMIFGYFSDGTNVTTTGLITLRRILHEMHRVLSDGASTDRVYKIIFEVVFSADTQFTQYDASGAQIIGSGTNTREGIPGAGDVLQLAAEAAFTGEETGEAQGSLAGEETEGGHGSIMLGSILLDRSEQQMMQREGGSVAPESMEGRELEEDGKSPSPVERTGKKKGFKRVAAKLL